MMPALSGINTLDHDANVRRKVCFMLYKEVVVDEDDACFVRINTLSKEKSVFLCYTRKSWSG